jgi:hypothetical protein
MSIVYNFFSFASNAMEQNVLNVNEITKIIPKDRSCKIFTNIKRHCWDESKDFVIKVKDGKITNLEIIEKINEYIKSNNTRSYFFEGIVSCGNDNYSFYWGS